MFLELLDIAKYFNDMFKYKFKNSLKGGECSNKFNLRIRHINTNVWKCIIKIRFYRMFHPTIL